MMDLLRLALTLTGAAAAPPPRRSSARIVFVVAAFAFAGLATVAALAVAAAALWIGVRPSVGPIGAPLVVASALLLLALIAAGLARRAGRATRAQAEIAPAAGGGDDAVIAELSRLVVAHKVPMLLAALIAGLAAGSLGG